VPDVQSSLPWECKFDDAHIVDDHKASRDGLRSYLSSNSSDKTVAATLVLDAVTMHESESVRIDRTLK